MSFPTEPNLQSFLLSFKLFKQIWKILQYHINVNLTIFSPFSRNHDDPPFFHHCSKVPQNYLRNLRNICLDKLRTLQMRLKSVNYQKVKYKKLILKKVYTQTLTCSPKRTAQRVSLWLQAGYIEETAGGAGRPLRHLYPVFTLCRMPFPSFKDMVKRTEVCLLIRLLVMGKQTFRIHSLKHGARAQTFTCRLSFHFQISWAAKAKLKSPACFQYH